MSDVSGAVPNPENDGLGIPDFLNRTGAEPAAGEKPAEEPSASQEIKAEATATAEEPEEVEPSVGEQINALMDKIDAWETEKKTKEAERKTAQRTANAADNRVKELDASILQTAIMVGAMLLKQKAGLGHGEWGPWLKANFPKSQNTAIVYMGLAENWHAIEAAAANSQRPGGAVNLTSIRKAQEVHDEIKVANAKKTGSVAALAKSKDETVTGDVAPSDGEGTGEVTSPQQPDPMAVSKEITLPWEAAVYLKKVVDRTQLPTAKIVELIFEGAFARLYEYLDDATLYGAGNAVMYFEVAEELGVDPAEAVKYIKINLSAGAWSGEVVAGPLWSNTTLLQRMKVYVAGAVALARWNNKPFEEIWNRCGEDRRNAQALIDDEAPEVTVEEAVKEVTARFHDDHVWHGLFTLARALPVKETKGSRAWQIYSTTKLLGEAKDAVKKGEPPPAVEPPASEPVTTVKRMRR
jgi:hypothetical protein